MFGYAVLALVCFVCLVSIAAIIGFSTSDGTPSTGEIILLVCFMLLCAVFGLCSLKRYYQSEVSTYKKPEIQMQITTSIENGTVASDTLYIYKFKKY